LGERTESKISKKERKKQEIIAAAIELFGRFGYKKTSITDIGEHLGLDQATIYYYIENKESLYVNCVLSGIEDLKQKLREAISKSSTLKETIITIFSMRLKFFLSNPLIRQRSDLNIKKINVQTRKKFAELRNFEHQTVTNLLTRGVDTGEINPCDCSLHASIMIYLSNGIQHSSMLRSFTEKIDIILSDAVAEQEKLISYIFKGLSKD
jgi:AcrR family transcriptional regulator